MFDKKDSRPLATYVIENKYTLSSDLSNTLVRLGDYLGDNEVTIKPSRRPGLFNLTVLGRKLGFITVKGNTAKLTLGTASKWTKELLYSDQYIDASYQVLKTYFGATLVSGSAGRINNKYQAVLRIDLHSIDKETVNYFIPAVIQLIAILERDF